MKSNYNKPVKLLILTQKVDINDPILGFFHGWIKEFAKHCEKVMVVCLQKGEYDLPENVRVLSLGKEDWQSRAKYIWRFYEYIWQERKNYDKVFVHMNPEYIVLGGIFWRLLRKKIGLWNNHVSGSKMARIGARSANAVFYTSLYAYNAVQGYQNAYQMPAGINTEAFKKINLIQEQNSILYIGRIDLVKKIEILIEACNELDAKNLDFRLNIYGNATDGNQGYFEKIKKLAKFLEDKGKVRFNNSVKNTETIEIYNANKIFVNMTNSGSLDKTILEAMSCETAVLVSNKSFIDILPNNMIFQENNVHDLASKLELLLKVKITNNAILRDYVVQNHSLSMTVKKVLNHL